MDKIIHKKIRLQCRPQRAFEYFTVNRLIVSWLAPKADVKPEVGGKYHLFWNKDDPHTDSSHGCKITGIEHGRFLSFEWKSFSQFSRFMDGADPKTHCVIFFLPVGDSGTETDVHLVHSGWRSSKEWEDARQWYADAWEHALSTLRSVVNKKYDY